MSGRVVAITVACLLLGAAAVAGVIGGLPWYLVLGIIVVPLFILFAYQHSRR